MTEHLTQRDRVLIAETIRRFILDDVDRRAIASTYTAEAFCVRATDLVYFADELLHCADGDSVDLAESVAADIHEIGDEWGSRAQDIHEQIGVPGLERLDAAVDEGVAREWMRRR
jgi:hypothetical protein